MAKITKRSADQLTPTGAEQWLWDSQVAGFGLRVSPKGKKTYVLQ